MCGAITKGFGLADFHKPGYLESCQFLHTCTLVFFAREVNIYLLKGVSEGAFSAPQPVSEEWENATGDSMLPSRGINQCVLVERVLFYGLTTARDDRCEVEEGGRPKIFLPPCAASLAVVQHRVDRS